jgi:hypothetical protein
VSIQPDSDDDAEVVDGLPVPAGPPPILEPVRVAQVPVAHAAALAATGFVAGAATAAMVTRRRLRPSRRRRKKGTMGEIVASNSFLVDVHLLRRD